MISKHKYEYYNNYLINHRKILCTEKLFNKLAYDENVLIHNPKDSLSLWISGTIFWKSYLIIYFLHYHTRLILRKSIVTNRD